MPKKTPYMPLYGKDAWSDEKFSRLPWDVQGLFWRLAYWQWIEGSIPADLSVVTVMTGKPRETKRLWPKMLEFFKPTANPARLSNAHLEELRADMLARRAKNVAGAEQTNKKRWGSHSESHSDSDSDRFARATATDTASKGESEGKTNARPRAADYGQKSFRSAAEAVEFLDRGKLHKVR